MRVRGLHLEVARPADLTDDDIDTLWRLRGRLIDLQPAVDPAVDRAAFFACLRGDHRVATVRDAHGAVVGFQDIAVHRWPGLLVLQGEYGFFDPRWRGHPMLPIMALALMVPAWARHGLGRRAWYVGDAYPAGFRPFVRAFRRVYLAGEPDLPAEAEALVDWLPAHLYEETWDAARHRIRLRTLPRSTAPRTPAEAATLARYERVNPDWAEGYAAFLMLPLDRYYPVSLTTLGRRLGRRRRDGGR